MAQPRLPFAPLRAAIGQTMKRQRASFNGNDRHGQPTDHGWTPEPGIPGTMLADLTGINRRTIQRWPERGLRPFDADQVACALGMHPIEIWPTEWADWLEDALA